MDLKKIDGHRHVYYSEAVAAADKLDRGNSVNGNPRGITKQSGEIKNAKAIALNRKMNDLSENLSDLKAVGFNMGILQPTKQMFFYSLEASGVAEIIRMVNEYTAKGVRQYPENYLGLAAVPLQNVELAVKELSYAVQELKLKGVVIGSNVNGHGFDEEQFLPFFDKAEALDIPVFIHPCDPAGSERVGRYYLENFLAFPLESTIAAAQLVFGGVLDRYPGLKICLSHAGGVLPFLLGRLEHGQSVRPETQGKCKNSFSYYLKNFYVDTLTFRPDTLRFVLEIMPEGHVFAGTDYPYDMSDIDPISTVNKAVADQMLRNKILGENLSKLIGAS